MKSASTEPKRFSRSVVARIVVLPFVLFGAAIVAPGCAVDTSDGTSDTVEISNEALSPSGYFRCSSRKPSDKEMADVDDVVAQHVASVKSGGGGATVTGGTINVH